MSIEEVGSSTPSKYTAIYSLVHNILSNNLSAAKLLTWLLFGEINIFLRKGDYRTNVKRKSVVCIPLASNEMEVYVPLLTKALIKASSLMKWS